MRQGIESKDGIIYGIDGSMEPPGDALQQASTGPAASQNWLPWLVGALALSGGLAMYLLTRKKIRGSGVGREQAKDRNEETMRHVRESPITSSELSSEPRISHIAESLDLALSGDALKGLNMLIKSGDFKDRSDFISYLTKTYVQNDIDSMMSKGIDPHTARVMGIIHKTMIAQKMFDSDIKKYLVPLLLAGFKAIHDSTTKKPARDVV
jgi:hypothetical protein